MCICVHEYMCICMYVYIHIYTYIYIYMNIYIHVHIFIYTQKCACVLLTCVFICSRIQESKIPLDVAAEYHATVQVVEALLGAFPAGASDANKVRGGQNARHMQFYMRTRTHTHTHTHIHIHLLCVID